MLAEGHSVVGVARQAGSLEGSPDLTEVVGDATDINTIVRPSNDSDAIISTLGAASANSTLMSDTVAAVIAASKVTGRKRFILMSAFTVEAGRLTGVAKLASGLMKGIVNDKTNSENLVRASDLD